MYFSVHVTFQSLDSNLIKFVFGKEVWLVCTVKKALHLPLKFSFWCVLCAISYSIFCPHLLFLHRVTLALDPSIQGNENLNISALNPRVKRESDKEWV